MSNYPRTFIYYDSLDEAIRHLAKNLSKSENKGKTYNLNGLIINLKKFKRAFRAPVKHLPSEKLILNNYSLLIDIAKKINRKNLINITHSKNKIRVFEITKLLFDYLKDFSCEELLNAIKSFQIYKKLKYDELLYACEAVILACLSEIDIFVQEYIKSGNLKNRAKFKPCECSDDEILKLSKNQIKINCAINIINNVQNIDFIELSDLYNLVKDRECLNEINNLSRAFLVEEKCVLDAISALQIKLDKSFEEVLFNYRYSIKLYLKNKTYVLTHSSVPILSFMYLSLVLILNLFISTLSILPFVIDEEIKLIFLNFLTTFRLSKFVIDKYFSGFLTKKCFTSMKNTSSFYKAACLISLFSGVSLVVIFVCSYILANIKILICASVLALIYILVFAGEKVLFVKNNFYKTKNKSEKIYENNFIMSQKFNLDVFRSIMLSNEKIKIYLDCFGNNRIYYAFEKVGPIYIYDEFGLNIADSTLNAAQYIVNKDCLENYTVEFSAIYAKYVNKINNLRLKIYLGFNKEIVIYETNSSSDLNLTFLGKIQNLVSHADFIELEYLNKSLILKFENVMYFEFLNEKIFLKIKNKTNPVRIFVQVLYKQKREILAIEEYFGKLANFANETKFILKNEFAYLKDINFVCELNFLIFNFSLLKYEQVFGKLKSNKMRTSVLFLKSNVDENFFNKVREVISCFYKYDSSFKILVLNTSDKIIFLNLDKNFKLINCSKNVAKNEQKLKKNLCVEISENNIKKAALKLDKLNGDNNLKLSNKIKSIYVDEKAIKSLKDGIFVKNPANLELCTIKGVGNILNRGFFKYFSKNIILYNFQNLFVIYDDKFYNLGAYILKNALIWNYSYIKSVVVIENDIFEVIFGIYPKNVCFYLNFSPKKLSKNSKFQGVILDLFSNEIMDNSCDVFVQQESNTVFKYIKSSFAGEMKFKLFLDFEYSKSISSYLNFDHNFHKFNSACNSSYFKSTFVLYFSRENILKSEQNLLIVFADDFTNNFNLNKSLILKNSGFNLSILNNVKVNLCSFDKLLNLAFNKLILYHIKSVLYSKSNNLKINFNSIANEFLLLEKLMYVDLNLVKDKILLFFSKVFIEGDILDNFVNNIGERNFIPINSIFLIYLFSKYLDFTKDLDILNAKSSFLKENNGVFITIDDDFNIEMQLKVIINYLKKADLDINCLIYLYKALLILIDFVSLDFKEEIVNYFIKIKKLILDKYQHNYFSLKNTSIITILDFLNLDLINITARKLFFENLKLDFFNLSEEEKIEYVKIKCKLFNENPYSYDHLINPLKNGKLFFDSANSSCRYYGLILNDYLNCKVNEINCSIKMPSLIGNSFKYSIYYNSKFVEVNVKYSKKNTGFYIDSKKVENLDNIDIFDTSKRVFILRRIY